jgi:hypothetical protein
MDSSFTFPAELTAPFELRGQLPRRIVPTGSGVQMAFATALLLALAASSAVWAGMTVSRHKKENAALSSSGQQVTAQIRHVWTAGALEPRISYVFTVNGTDYTAMSRLPKPLVKTLAHSATLPVRYLPANPAVNHPAAWEESPRSESTLLLAPAIAALLGLSLLLPLGIERRMANQGRPALAMVKKCTRSRSGYLVNYEFRPEGGTAIRGRGWYQAHQEPGEGIWVLYLPKAPRRNFPYPLCYWKVTEWAN